jgi:hypothetical protein
MGSFTVSQERALIRDGCVADYRGVVYKKIDTQERLRDQQLAPPSMSFSEYVTFLHIHHHLLSATLQILVANPQSDYP